MSKIYTATGDNGFTSLVGGKKVPKTHIRLEAYGTVDELSSHIGLLHCMITDTHNKDFLYTIQKVLFLLSANLATESDAKYKPQQLDPNCVQTIENEIDAIQAELPPFRAFILPGGCAPAAQAHVCRTVCRRAERRIYTVAETCNIDEHILKYINRLSDYFFVLAQKINKQQNIEEMTTR